VLSNSIDLNWLTYACQLAERVSERAVSPNPRVGAVVLDVMGHLVGQGWHAKAGTPHAEVHALAMAGEQAKGGTLYVTLEPCHHHGKTPPCTQAIVNAGVAKVVYGMPDPNPLVAGKGLAYLTQMGLTVEGPVLPEQCQALNPVFCHHIVHNTPFVAVKLATTMDGYMADAEGNSQWITSPAARQHVHQQRARFAALLTTSSTVLADDCQLTVRLTGDSNPPAETLPADPSPADPPPIRVVLDRNGRLLSVANTPTIFTQLDSTPTWVFTNAATVQAYQQAYPQLVIKADEADTKPGDNKPVDNLLEHVFTQLYQAGLTSLWVEAGPTLTSQLLSSTNGVQQVWWYRAGKLFGKGTPATKLSTPTLLHHTLDWQVTSHLVLGQTDTVTCWQQ
jgi:diaminohydroxyphosphoribosylaminopyrimidine deaminase / 5-amino-6-(5-phosphoribosylamino)uracil reductase